MAKAKSKGKSSKVKLANKSSNKKGKGKVRISNQVVPQQARVSQVHEKKAGKKVKVSLPPEVPLQEDSNINDEDLAFSDEEMLDYVHENVNSLSLFTKELDNVGKKKLKENVVQYENGPREFSQVEQEQKSDKIDLLPVKGDRGLIKRSREAPDVVRSIEEEEEKEETELDVNEKQEHVPVLSMVEVLANHHMDVNSKKLQIAQLSQEIIENTDKISKLKQLVDLTSNNEALIIQKLALLSLSEIFKDIVPSYRIRSLTEEEQRWKVSKNVAELRDVESCLLSNYQKYLERIEENIKGCVKLEKKRRKNGCVKESSLKAKISLSTVSAQCICDMLKAAPHFNFRDNIIAFIIPQIELIKGDLNEVGQICFDGVKSALLADKVGDVSLEVVKVINKLVKSKVHVEPKVIEVLLFLRLNSEAIKAAEEKGNKKDRLKAKREKLDKMSRKERKYNKFEEQLNKEMQEAEAVENQDKIEKVHTEILNFLFVIYFRVLKADHITSLLPGVLKGLAKFSHLINVEFFQDLMIALERILKTDNVQLTESLNCIRSAVKILSGQGEILNIDPKQFYTELYERLLYVAADTLDENLDMAKSCLEELLLKRRKQVSIPLVMGFFKRISTILLQLPGINVVEYSMLLRSVLQSHTKCDHLLESDSCSQGVFQPEIADPEYCNAQSTMIWELVLLLSHYNPFMDTISKNITNGAPSQGIAALSSKFISRTNKRPALGDDSTFGNILPDFVPENPISKSKRFTNVEKWKSEELKTACESNNLQISIEEENLNFLLPNAKRKKSK